METAFVMECEEEELEPVQHDDDDDELDDGLLPTLQNGSGEELSRRAKLSAMDEFEVALSEEVRKYKHIYNSSLKDHRDSRMVNRSWREISETLSADATYCKKRWQNLRDKFTKARRRMMRSPGGRVNRVPVLYTVLRWLDGHIKPKASMKFFQTETQEHPSPSWQPISRSPSTDIELEMSTINCNTDEFDCAVPDTPSPAPSPVPAPSPAPSVPVPLPPPTPPPQSTPTPTPTASSRPVPLPLPVPSPTDVPALCPGPSTTLCPGPPTPSLLGPSATSSLGPSATSSLGPSATSSLGPSATSSLGPSASSSLGPSATSSLGPSATSSLGPSNTSSLGPSATSSLDRSASSSLDRSAPRSRKRKRASEPEGLNYESLFAALDQRRAAREAAMEAGRERRTAVLERLLGQQDECDRYVLHVADFMRSLPPDHRSEFKFKLQNLMRETEQAVRNGVAENGLAAVQKTEQQNWEER